MKNYKLPWTMGFFFKVEGIVCEGTRHSAADCVLIFGKYGVFFVEMYGSTYELRVGCWEVRCFLQNCERHGLMAQFLLNRRTKLWIPIKFRQKFRGFFLKIYGLGAQFLLN